MKAYERMNEEGEVEIFAAEESAENFLCDLELACCGFPVYTEEYPENKTTPDYITETGLCIFSGSPVIHEALDVEKTDCLMKEEGNLPFSEWDFNFYLGTFWNGHDWEIIVIEL